VFKIFRKKEEKKEEAPPMQQHQNMTKQQVLNCITSGGGDCDNCQAIKKCLKLRKQLKKIGMRV